MTESENFAERIRERFPEGLTGIFAVGGTRTGFILENNRKNDDAGAITDFSKYAHDAHELYFRLIKDFLELGGHNVIVPVLAYQLFFSRGEDYARMVSELCLRLTNERSVEFYRQHSISPYFVGIDTLLQLPEDHFAYALGVGLANFQSQWDYREENRKVIWEIASIPLFSLWRADQVLGVEAREAFEAKLESAQDLQEIHDITYMYYSRAVYGVDVPIPHFYVGTSKNGDLKLRSLLPIALLCGDPFRMFYVPYPSLFMTKTTLKTIIDDVAFGATVSSKKRDYSGQVTSEMLEAEYQRVIALSGDPNSTVGLTRQMGDNS